MFSPRKLGASGAIVLAIAAFTACAAAPTPSGPGSAGTGGSIMLQPAPEGPIGTADGQIPEGQEQPATSDVPAVKNLHPDLRSALQRASDDAEADNGVQIRIASGWRSNRYQEQLLQDAVREYGSLAEARRWVATSSTSAHVRGEAVDIGPWAADDWLEQHGARYGLCRTYENERWHFELRAEAPQQGCPQPYADPTHDPRMKS